LLIDCAKEKYSVDLQKIFLFILAKWAKPPAKAGLGEICFPCFVLVKYVKTPPNKIAQDLGLKFGSKLDGNKNIVRIDVVDAYLNFFISIPLLAQIIPSILSGNFLNKQSSVGHKVMIEYSQPNTHKVFHVGHMRNAALGDSLVRFYEHAGYPVVAVNYFGDEGAHVAKCLWQLRIYMRTTSDFKLSKVPVAKRGEFLGQFYAKAVEELDMSTFTATPFPGVYAAKVISVNDHPDPSAPPNWHVVIVEMDQQYTVVCGGLGYKVGDIVAYIPCGQKFKGNVVEPKDMKGVSSHGIIVARRELGLSPLKNVEVKKEKAEDEKKKKGNKGKKKEAKNVIYVLEPETKIGIELPEMERLPNTSIPDDVLLSVELKKRSEEVGATLRAMEEGDKDMCQLWKETKQWSLKDFKKIYKWLDCRFDHDFFESDCGEESLQMVEKYYKQGLLINSDGAIGADLTKFKLGFCMLRKSNGCGLYATKDLALARIKFDKFQIDESIYIVDASQTLHFQQVFKTLELMGYKQARKCVHIPYGLVVLPHGKMSSRKGTVIFFSELKNMLHKQIVGDFLGKYKNDWDVKEIEAAVRAISVACIKYGMLNHDTAKDIVFELKDWTAKTGNTGAYLMYAYSRVASIKREVPVPRDVEPDWNLLKDPKERCMLGTLNDFWVVIIVVIERRNPSPMCDYLYYLAKAFSGWYETHHIKKAESDELKATRLAFVSAVGAVLKTGLNLLGIQTIERM